jgi:FSR family fosmidomycin resistance protein-like MFS transporter
MALLIPVLVAFVLAPSPVLAALLVTVAGFATIATFSISVVMGQEYLPSRLGLASGVTMGLSIGIGGIAAAGLGVLADVAGLRTVMWVIAALSLPLFALARTLPVTRAERRAQGLAAAAAAAAAGAPPRPAASARPATAQGSASPHP